MVSVKPPETGKYINAAQQSFSDFITDLLAAYTYMPGGPSGYIKRVVTPAIVLFVLSVISAPLLTTDPMLIGLIMSGGGFGVFVAVIYPKLLKQRKAKEIRDNFHMFLTHMTALSTTGVERIELFRRLGQVDEYGALAEEMATLVGMVETFNISLDDACRSKAKHTPSPLLADFYERLAYNIGAGQDISQFLFDEQEVIIDQFSTRYTADLERLNVVTELYNSLTMAVSFLFVFSLIMPVLTGISPMLATGGVAFGFFMAQVLFLMIVHTMSPEDQLWFVPDEWSAGYRAQIGMAVLIGVSLSLIFLAVDVLYLFTPAKVADPNAYVPLQVALPTLPLFIPGVYILYLESKVKDRDNQFPSFIRALGSIEHVKQSSTSQVLRSLRNKDFGELTEAVNRLFKRLGAQTDSEKSWEHFAGETGSYLISKFADMYVTARVMGGNPRKSGTIISENMTELLNLREHRDQQVTTLNGYMYGTVTTTAFTFFVCLEIIQLLVQMVGKVNAANASLDGLLHLGVYNVPTLYFVVIASIVLNSLVSAAISRFASRAHLAGIFFHFPLLVWVGMIVGVATQHAFGMVLGT